MSAAEVAPASINSSELLAQAKPPVPGAVSGLSANLARRAAMALATRRSGGTIELVEDGSTRRIGVGEPTVRVEVHDRRAFAAVLGAGSVGLGSSYVARWWDCDDLVGLVQVLSRWSGTWRARLDRLGGLRALRGPLGVLGRLHRPTNESDRANIQAHYDLSNEFFALVLDPSMTYSCAYFSGPGEDLEVAQLAKIDRLLDKLALAPTDHLLEIGTGWGALALRAATRYGCRVTTTTISDEQRSYVTDLVERAGLADRVTVLGEHWRELGGKYDKLVSVEMIEAIEWTEHDEFLARCAELVRENGTAAIQAIVIDDASFERAKLHDDFIRRMVFPGSCIPSIGSISASLARATDLRIVDLEDIGRHYAETLARWSANLTEHHDELGELGVTDEFLRLFELYLAYCEASFLERHVSDVQLLLAKPSWRAPLAKRAP